MHSILTVLPKITPFSTGSDVLYPGDYFSLQCAITHGDLPLSIFWKLNDRILENNNEVRISQSDLRSSVLTIESIRDYHAGNNLTCVGKNTAGVANYTVTLVVKGSNLFPNFIFLIFFIIFQSFVVPFEFFFL